jgi:hypothetical protein
VEGNKMKKDFELYFIKAVSKEDKVKVFQGDSKTIVKVAQNYARYRQVKNLLPYIFRIVMTTILLIIVVII